MLRRHDTGTGHSDVAVAMVNAFLAALETQVVFG